MTAKLAVTIVAFGLMGAAMLSIRQSRLQAAHEVTEARLRLPVHDERLTALRVEIAERVAPARVREMLEETGQAGELAPLAERIRRTDEMRPTIDQTVPDRPAGDLPGDLTEELAGGVASGVTGEP